MTDMTHNMLATVQWLLMHSMLDKARRRLERIEDYLIRRYVRELTTEANP